jgi:hypothetical protein
MLHLATESFFQDTPNKEAAVRNDVCSTLIVPSPTPMDVKLPVTNEQLRRHTVIIDSLCFIFFTVTRIQAGLEDLGVVAGQRTLNGRERLRSEPPYSPRQRRTLHHSFTIGN